MAMYVCMALGLAAAPSGVKIFAEERVVYWRETGAGHSRLAYFLGVTTASFYRIGLNSLHYSMTLHVLCRPIMGFGAFYLVVSHATTHWKRV
jgi:hypothetical protein